MNLTCPVCKEAMCAAERTFRCANGHSFDRAKEGYLNLLLSHQRRSRHPGDGRAMIQARRRFFDSGAFDPLQKLAAELIAGSNVLDCGCGEGFFSGALSEVNDGQFIGIDISKEAVRCAAKRYKKALWIVANGMRELPLADTSMDTILSILAPRNPAEFARVLKPGGTLILGVPGPNHLIELRSLLSQHVSDFEEKADEAVAKCAPQFTESDRQNLSYELDLSPAQLANLIQMTPIFWNSSPEAKQRAAGLPGLRVTVSFVLLSLKSNGVHNADKQAESFSGQNDS
ncbi:MAG: putative RNA methyltransferase [Kiritimatiellales bacterium]